MAKASQFLRVIDRNKNLVRGECYDVDHIDEIMLTGWDWSAKDPAALPKSDKGGGGAAAGQSAGSAASGRSGTASASAGAGARSMSSGQGETKSDIDVSTFSFTKQTDRSTTRLINAMDRGEVFPIVTLVIEEEFEDVPNAFYMQISLTDAFLVDFGWNGTAAQAGLTYEESWKMNYRTIEFTYRWRGHPPATISADFKRSEDASDTASRKTPTTAAEQQEKDRRQFEEFNKAAQKRTGK